MVEIGSIVDDLCAKTLLKDIRAIIFMMTSNVAMRNC